MARFYDVTPRHLGLHVRDHENLLHTDYVQWMSAGDIMEVLTIGSPLHTRMETIHRMEESPEKRNKIKFVEILLKNACHVVGPAIDTILDNDQHTFLHWACLLKMNETIDLLISQGAKLDARNRHGHTPLEASIIKSDHRNVDVLCRRGASFYWMLHPATSTNARDLRLVQRKTGPMDIIKHIHNHIEAVFDEAVSEACTLRRLFRLKSQTKVMTVPVRKIDSQVNKISFHMEKENIHSSRCAILNCLVFFPMRWNETTVSFEVIDEPIPFEQPPKINFSQNGDGKRLVDLAEHEAAFYGIPGNRFYHVRPNKKNCVRFTLLDCSHITYDFIACRLLQYQSEKEFLRYCDQPGVVHPVPLSQARSRRGVERVRRQRRH